MKIKYISIGFLNYLLGLLIFTIFWQIFQTLFSVQIIIFLSTIVSAPIAFHNQMKYTFENFFNLKKFSIFLIYQILLGLAASYLVLKLSEFTGLQPNYSVYVLSVCIAFTNWLILKR